MHQPREVSDAKELKRSLVTLLNCFALAMSEAMTATQISKHCSSAALCTASGQRMRCSKSHQVVHHFMTTTAAHPLCMLRHIQAHVMLDPVLTACESHWTQKYSFIICLTWHGRSHIGHCSREPSICCKHDA